MTASKARELLGILLDRVEDKPDRTRPPSEAASMDFQSANDREAFLRILGDAERNGGISVVKGRGEAGHLIDRIRLRDAPALYAFLGRVPADELAREAVAKLRARSAAHNTEAAQALDAIAAGWLRGERPLGLGRERVAQAAEFIVALEAALSRDTLDRRDLRTYSGQVTGDSKLMERHGSRIVAFLQGIGRLDAGLSDSEALASLGLEKFPQPVLISGPVRVGAADFSQLVYVGIAPEQAPLVEPSAPTRSLVTIENLASFNRHVREARLAGDVVVYTGGFPSRAVAAALVAISRWPDSRTIHHWGDIDEGGLRIALNLSSVVSIPVVPHLMTPDLAQQHGSPTKPVKLLSLPPDHPWQILVDFLRSDEARHLEQEKIDPQPISDDRRDDHRR